MKTFTMLAAVAALVGAMVSLADAQGSMGQSGQSGSSMKSGQSGSMQQGAMDKATGSGKFCVEKSAGGGWDCKYASLQACEKDAKAQNLQCHPNPNTGNTTGSKQ